MSTKLGTTNCGIRQDVKSRGACGTCNSQPGNPETRRESQWRKSSTGLWHPKEDKTSQERNPMNTSARLNTRESDSSSPFARIALLSTIPLVTAMLLVSRPCGAQTPPPAVDNSAGLPPVNDQGSQHSSHAWALAYYCKTYQEGRVRGWDVSVPEHQFSPSFLYNQIAPFDEGTSFAELLPRLADQGCATLADFPYVEADHTTWPPYTAFRDAINYRIQSYTWLGYGLTPGVIANMKRVLAGGDLCVIEVPVFKPDANTKGLFERLNSTNYFYAMPADEDVYVESNQALQFVGNALTVVGYDDSAFGGNGGFKVVNSWGRAGAIKGLLGFPTSSSKHLLRTFTRCNPAPTINPLPSRGSSCFIRSGDGTLMT